MSQSNTPIEISTAVVMNAIIDVRDQVQTLRNELIDLGVWDQPQFPEEPLPASGVALKEHLEALSGWLHLRDEISGYLTTLHTPTPVTDENKDLIAEGAELLGRVAL